MNADEAKSIFEKHISLLAKKQRLENLSATVIRVESIRLSSNISQLANTFCDSYPYAVLNDTGELVDIAQPTDEAPNSFQYRTIIPLIAEAEFFVSSILAWEGQKELLHGILKRGAFPGDTETIIDSFTQSYVIISAPQILSGSRRLQYIFKNGFGRIVASYEVRVCSNCSGSRLKTCDGSVTGNDSSPLMSAHVDFKKSISNGCCVIDYAMVGTGGWPDIKISWSGKKSKFDADISGYGWQYFQAIGSLSHCCPEVTIAENGEEPEETIETNSEEKIDCKVFVKFLDASTSESNLPTRNFRFHVSVSFPGTSISEEAIVDGHFDYAGRFQYQGDDLLITSIVADKCKKNVPVVITIRAERDIEFSAPITDGQWREFDEEKCTEKGTNEFATFFFENLQTKYVKLDLVIARKCT